MKENNSFESENSLKTIHTYSSDMAEAVRDNGVSVIKIALAEQKKREHETEYKKSEVSPLAKFFLFLGGVIILALAVGAVYYVSQKNKSNSTVAIVAPANNSTIIPFSKQLVIDITSKNNFNEVVKEMREKIPTIMNQAGVLSVSLVRSTPIKPEHIPLENFLSFIPVTAPDSLVRSLDTDYMLGYYQSVDTKRAPRPFIIFKTKEYNQTYAGMLTWEKTLASDFSELFSEDVSTFRSSIQERPWRDVIIQNNNARVLYDDKRNAMLYYIFVNKDYFIITDDKDTVNNLYPLLLLRKSQ